MSSGGESFSKAIGSSIVWGVGGKALGILKHSVIAGAIGLSAQLDAFYAATSVLAVMVFLIVGVFDVLGVPRLIKLHNNGESEKFYQLSRSLFVFSVLLGLISFMVMVLLHDELTFLAQGFEDERRQILSDGLLILSTIALVYFPLRQLAAIHRAQSNFSIYYRTDFIVTAVWFIVIYIYRDVAMVLFFSWPVAVLFGLIYILYNTPSFSKLIGNPICSEAKSMWKKAPALAILQGLLGLHVAVDHFFASYLPVGSIGSLSLAMVIITALVGILRLDTSFITVFGKAFDGNERSAAIDKLISFSLFVSVPYVLTLIFMGDSIVKMLFEYGVFKSEDGEKIFSVLIAYSPSVLVMVLLPALEEVYQISDRVVYILKRATFGLILNALLCYIFIFKLEYGSVGIALSTSLSMVATLVYALIGLSDLGVILENVKYLKQVIIVAVPVSLLGYVFSEIGAMYNYMMWNMLTLSAYIAVLIFILLFLPCQQSRSLRMRSVSFIKNWM
jgi:putative peptidoglycan lipid II flippase